jgi:hypothetical protein
MTERHPGPQDDAVLPHAADEPDRRRRALLKLGWTVPVILAMGIPRNAFASVYVNPTNPGGTGQAS